jgi:hypothetical protein
MRSERVTRKRATCERLRANVCLVNVSAQQTYVFLCNLDFSISAVVGAGFFVSLASL